MVKIAVLMPNWIGDAAMATPTVRALANTGTSLVGVMQPVIGELLAGSPWFSEEITVHKRRWSSRLQLALKLRATRADAIVLLTNSLWTAAVARLSGIPRRYGYAHDGRGWLLTDRLNALKRDGRFEPVPAIDYYLQLAASMGSDVADRRMELFIQPEDRKLADDFLASIHFSSQKPLVVINSSGAWGAAKLWPVDHVEQLARRLVENHDWQVVLHCGPAEREAANAVVARLKHPQVQSMGRATSLPVRLSKAVLAQAAVVVSTDSGPRHMAVALNRPVVSLFGPTDANWTKTYNVPEMELGLKIACRGCWKKECPLGHHRCMRDIGVELVYGQVVQAMHASALRKAA